MAKIIIIAYSNQIWVHPLNPDPFVQGFSNALARMGNSVKSIILNDLLQTEINNEVISYAPDLIISFNGAGVSDTILKRTHCAVVIDVCDALCYLRNIEIIKTELDRFYFISGSREFIEQTKTFFPDLPKNHISYLGHVTDLRKKDMEQDIPLSFVGSLGNWDKTVEFYWQNAFQKTDFSNTDQIKELMKKKEAFQKQMNEFASRALDLSILSDPVLDDFSETCHNRDYAQAVIMLRTCNLRFAVLEQLMDLGLKIYSYPFGMVDAIRYSFKMFECFDFTPSVTLADSEITFNRSKISLNLPHGQTKHSFSWRVPDILASNACLLSNYVTELKELMTGYIDIPMYESSAEARELAQKLLKDDVWRKEIVAASQQMIEDKCRFEHRLRKVAEETGLKLEYPEEKGHQELIRVSDKYNHKY